MAKKYWNAETGNTRSHANANRRTSGSNLQKFTIALALKSG